jgi:hypothetical protein
MPDRQLTLLLGALNGLLMEYHRRNNLLQWFRLHPSIGTEPLSLFLSWGQNTPLYMCPRFINIRNISYNFLCTSFEAS